MPGCPTNLDNCTVMAHCTCSRCGWGMVRTFFSFSFSMGDGPFRLKYCLKGLSSPKQPTNQILPQSGPQSVTTDILTIHSFLVIKCLNSINWKYTGNNRGGPTETDITHDNKHLHKKRLKPQRPVQFYNIVFLACIYF